jgi:type-F conjugative transfer system pilin assembly protein TrbC
MRTEASTAFLEEARRIMGAPQQVAPEIRDWGLQDQAAGTLNSIVIPEGEWPLAEMGVPSPGTYPYHLYILVSDSMPEGLIRSYALDAIQTGAQIVVRGIKPDETIQQATQKWAKLALRSDGASPGISIDPRPFSAFQVETVPAIVLATKSVADLCESTESTFSITHDTAGALGSLPYKTCLPAPETSYYKITGNVSVPWALKSMMTIDDNPVLQNTAKSWFSVLPGRYNTSADNFGWAPELTGEQFSESADPKNMKEWLENLAKDRPGMGVIKTDKGYGLGPVE